MKQTSYKGYCITIEKVPSSYKNRPERYSCYINKGDFNDDSYGARLINPKDHNPFFSTEQNALEYAQEFITNQVPD